jgi:proline dehydrogenase
MSSWKDYIRRPFHWALAHAAAGYVAGPHVFDALAVCERLRQKNWVATICPWEALGTKPADLMDRYRTALESIAAAQIDCYLSMKVPSLNFDQVLLKELAHLAQASGIRLHCDSLGPETVQPTFALLEALRKEGICIGYTLPARWQRSSEDVKRITDLQIPVRLVKGQWADPSGRDADASRSYLEIVDRLCGHSATVAVATHDTVLAAEALKRLTRAATPCELEQLYGLPCRGARHAQSLKVKVRVYVPYDYGYLPYAFSQLRKRPIIAWWLLRDVAASIMRLSKSPSLSNN